MRLLLTALLAACCALFAATPPTPLTGAAELQQTLDRLNTLGSVLMLAAHPDDENTAVIAYFARGRHIRTAYLSATRGEGGQNLIGSEQGALMGLIRTQELLAARRIDGGEQFFSRAIDFGYSKTPKEALDLWGSERLLGDMVRVIRTFRPDVVIARFPPPPGTGGHGQHTAVGHTGPEAFRAAADPARFPGQLKQGLEPWQAKRYYFNVFQFGRPRNREADPDPDQLSLDVGEYAPVLGKSFAEIAGESRSMHRSQAMGTRQRKGSQQALFNHVAGDKADVDLFDGIDVTWGRVPGGDQVGDLLARARDDHDPRSPEEILPHLLDAWKELAKLEGHWPHVKRAELLRAIELASGLWLDAVAERWDATPGAQLAIELTALNRSKALVVWAAAGLSSKHGLPAETVEEPAASPLVFNEPASRTVTLEVSNEAAYSQPPWLIADARSRSYQLPSPSLIGLPEPPPVAQARFDLTIQGVNLSFTKPVVYRWVDRSRGERERAVQIVPPIAVTLSRPNLIFPSRAPRDVAVVLTNNVAKAQGTASLELPPGWSASPASIAVDFDRTGQERSVSFRVTPPSDRSGGELTASFALAGRKISTGVREIEYDHIPIQVVFPRARMRVERTDVVMLSNRIGYVMGPGDDVPAALEELGAQVTLLGESDLASADLSVYDAIVTGVRALNTRPDLHASKERLLAYVEQGGTLVEQYSTTTLGRRRGSRPPALIAPYELKPFSMSFARDDRVTDEAAPVILLDPKHPLLNAPNKITAEDFDGWVQERGLYFMEEWGPEYEAVWASNDAGQEPQPGGMLYARHGRGVYIFSAYSWFRQLPAGVPGAYRLFANLVSAK